jgi:hypothetical protein
MAGPRNLGWLSLKRRPSPTTSILPSPTMHTDEYATPSPIAAQPQSFGNDFNLIRAVEEYGPQRVASIRQELAQMEVRQTVLTKEMQTLEKLIAVTKPNGVASQDIVVAPVYVATAFDKIFEVD